VCIVLKRSTQHNWRVLQFARPLPRSAAAQWQVRGSHPAPARIILEPQRVARC
jgi:hypothetical protein